MEQDLCILTIGFILFFLNWWLLVLPLPLAANTALYIFTMTAGYLSLLAAGVWISRLLKNNLMDDVFNLENESFAQETRLDRKRIFRKSSFSFLL